MNTKKSLFQRRVKVGIRPSPLALKQAEEIKRYFPGLAIQIVPIETCGDRDKVTPLVEVRQEDFFTREIDRALLRGELDLAVHSSKDLPEPLPLGLEVIFESPCISPYDSLVSRGSLSLRELPSGSRIGVSSSRRREGALAQRKDLAFVDVRGNIEERLNLIDSNIIDGLIVAHAALLRLGLADRIAEIFPLSIFKTHPKQGRISVVARRG